MPRPTRACVRDSWRGPPKLGGHADGAVGGGRDAELIDDETLSFERGEPVGEDRRLGRRDCDGRLIGPARLVAIERQPDLARRLGEKLVDRGRSEEHTSELQSLMRISY